MQNKTTRTWEVYGAGVGFIGYVSARTEIGAIRIAKKIFAAIASDFAVKGA